MRAGDDWSGDELRYAAMCYSDVPYLYTGRGLRGAAACPYSDTGGRYQAMEYPVVIGYFAYGAAVVTHALTGWPDRRRARGAVGRATIYGAPGVAAESGLYFVVTAVLLAAVRRCWPPGSSPASTGAGPGTRCCSRPQPALVLAGLINWDLLAVAASPARCGRGRGAGRCSRAC